MFDVRRSRCSTCIYRKDSSLSLAKLERDIADPHMPGYFTGYRICHHSPKTRPLCCAGFWQRHKNNFTLGQLAQRLGFVRLVRILHH